MFFGIPFHAVILFTGFLGSKVLGSDKMRRLVSNEL
jgi:hypothetical protein